MADNFQQALAWAKDWQPLIGGLLALLASIIFAVGAITAAHIKAGSGSQSPSRPTKKPSADLRSTRRPELVASSSQPLDLLRTLEQLRSLVRSALSALTPNGGITPGTSATLRLSYEKIIGLQSEKLTLSPEAPASASEQLAILEQQIDAFSVLISRKAPAPEIANSLIKINTAARTLAQSLSQGPEDKVAAAVGSKVE